MEKLEKDLWEAADNLRANSKLTSSDYFMPVLGVIFLRHAANRFEGARQQIETDRWRRTADGLRQTGPASHPSRGGNNRNGLVWLAWVPAWYCVELV
ncbi:MAG: hypothetical protein DMG70_22450 [Acidobacteria bacterium]|nr:MAG: hypothetical protein DMG70_22450 [Acidobacteriota bacterium]